MRPVRIVTDSTAHLTPDEIQRLGITVIPARIRLGRRVYKEGVEITTDAYFRKLEGLKTLPQLLPPLLQDFLDVYHRLSRETDQIVSIHASSILSGAYEAARTAAASLRGHTRIAIIDSETMSRGVGMLVRIAAEASAAGANVNEVSRLVRGMVPSVFMGFFVDDLSYAERDQRIRQSQAILGSMFRIKPLVEIREGDLVVMEKVRTQADVIEKLFNYISEFVYLEEIALLQNQFTPDATALLERLEQVYPNLSIFTDTYGPSLATYIGPAALGVVVRENTQG